ncbi:MAG: HepT-like ribonuclease domain-containing protein [Campylobacterota bacterium]|nr:HepT-like ribonuclease domain-containing protein [Campylobacterota bacterium]
MDKEYWSKIIRTREILTHHYIDIDAETIYMICVEKLLELEEKILKLRATISTN